VAWTALLLAGVGVGIYCFTQQVLHGLTVTHMRTVGSGGAGWGLYIAFDVVFIGISFAGITVAALIRLFNLENLKPLSRMAELLTIVCLALGACIILADLGRPIDGLLKLPRLARPDSPFFGTFTMVIGGYLFSSLVYFFLACRPDAALCAEKKTWLRPFYRLWASGYRGTRAELGRHHQSSFWLSLFILPLLVTAHSTLGFIFGIQGGRPGWFSALQAPSFVAMAGASGIGVLIIVAAVLRKVLHLEEVLGVLVFRWLGNLSFVLTLIVLYFLAADELTASYASALHEREFVHMMITGPYRHLFFLELGSLGLALLIYFAQFALRKASVWWTVLGAISVNVGAVVKRYLLVVPSQTHGQMLPYAPGEYHPSFIELGLIAGLLCLGMLLYTIFVKIFPILPVAPHARRAGRAVLTAQPQRPLLRRALWIVTLVAGAAMAVVGFLISSRYGVAPYADPLLPFSPVLFIAGLILSFSAPIVYEVFPVRRAATQASHSPPAPSGQPAPGGA
jgi:molybdopterin-containing oxidoreductase family membrane subunit